MKLIRSIWLIMLILMAPGCVDDENDYVPLPGDEYPFNESYFYYSNKEKQQLFLYKNELTVKFKGDSVGEAEAFNHIKKYFRNRDSVYVSAAMDDNYFRLKIINDDSGYLKETIGLLNADSLIDYSTPIFSTNPDPIVFDYPSGCEDALILMDEIVCNPLIPEPRIEPEFAEFGLTIIKQSRFYTVLKVNEIKSGFEALGVSAYLYESGKFLFCHPNFIASVCPL